MKYGNYKVNAFFIKFGKKQVWKMGDRSPEGRRRWNRLKEDRKTAQSYQSA